MQPSMFNVRVPLDGRDDVFLMNTFSDAQLIVSRDVADVLDRVDRGERQFAADERDAIETLVENGFIVESRDADRQALDEFFHNVREDRSQLRVTVLTTLQCNFACDYCIQGDHGDYNKHAAKMSLETAARTAEWAEQRLDAVAPSSFALTFFGGEPLLNLPVLFYLAERLAESCRVRGVRMTINVITNGLLLTPAIVDRLVPLGLNGIKVTLDGDRDTHNRMRPLRGGQGTFDKILQNVRQVAGKCRISIGGNFDEQLGRQLSGAARLPARAGLRRQAREGGVQADHQAAAAGQAEGPFALTAVGADGKPLGGACMTSAGTGVLERLRQLQLPRRQDVVPARGDDCAAASRPWTACTWARARSTSITPTPSARTARSTPARASPARPRSRPATSTAATNSGGASRRSAST